MLAMEVEYVGFKQLGENFENIDLTIARIFLPKITKGSLHLEGEVKERTPVGVSGDARRSIKSKTSRLTSGQILIRSKVGSNIKGPQMPTLEAGRKAGAAMPPPAALELWVKRVLGVPDTEVKAVAFIVARSIGQKGFKGAKMFEEGFESATPVINKFLIEGLDELMKELAEVN